MVEVIVILCECITVLICLHIVFNKEIKFNIKSILFLALYVGIFYLIARNILDKAFVSVLFIGIVLYCFMMSKRHFIQTVIGLLLGLVLVGFIETMIMFLFIPVMDRIKNQVAINLFMAIGILLLAIVLFVVTRKKRLSIGIEKVNKNLIFCTGIAAVFLGYIKFDFEKRRSLHIIFYLLAFVVLGIVFIEMLKEQKADFELEKKELELSLHERYSGAYRELLDEVRRRQHDYNNQLTAIYSMHLTATSLEELITMQRKYGDLLREKSCFDSILTGCHNSILAGYIYSLCIKFKKQGIIVRPDVKVYEQECDIQITDIIEILGALLNNAFESVSAQKEEGNCIKLVLLENNSEFYIEVSNRSNYISYQEIESMFRPDYSTKGKNRGIGLTSVKNIMKKYRSNIYVDNYQEDNQNWFRFKLLIVKLNYV